MIQTQTEYIYNIHTLICLDSWSHIFHQFSDFEQIFNTKTTFNDQTKTSLLNNIVYTKTTQLSHPINNHYKPDCYITVLAWLVK